MGDKDVVNLLSGVIDKAKTEYVQSAASMALGFIGDYTCMIVAPPPLPVLPPSLIST